MSCSRDGIALPAQRPLRLWVWQPYLRLYPPGYALAGALLTAGTVATYRLPVISLSLLLVVGIGPAVLSQADLPWLATITSLGKLSLADAVLSAMLLAVAIRGHSMRSRDPSRGQGAFAIALAVSVGDAVRLDCRIHCAQSRTSTESTPSDSSATRISLSLRGHTLRSFSAPQPSDAACVSF